MKHKYCYAAGAFLILAVLSALVFWHGVGEASVRFSEDTAFQEEAFELNLKSGFFGGEIYYTLDGSDPTPESAVYDGPILIQAGEPVRATVVKAAALTAGKLGEICTRTYFVGKDIGELFDVMVVSLSTNETNLYDERTGIFANCEEFSETGEWDRPAYIEFFEPDGKLMLRQGTGIAVSGHGSRGFEQKSIKLIASSVYDMEHPTFDYDFFETDMAGNPSNQSYNRLVLRNGGSDHEGTMIKWNVVSRLAKECGIVCAGARPGILFLNGEYYGIIQLQEKYTAYNVTHAIGARKDDFEKFEPNEVNSSRFGGYYNRLNSDLNDPERQTKLESSVDMEDMLWHYAANVVMNNNDWPFHNFLSWKCADTGISSYSDGKVRFFLYDLDAVYRDTSGMDIPNIFAWLMEEPSADSTDTLYLLMQSDKYRTQFVNIVCGLTSTVFTEEHVLEIIKEEDQKLARSRELFWMEEQKQRQQAAVETMKEAVTESCTMAHEGLQKYLGAENPYTLSIETEGAAHVAFSQIKLDTGERYIGTYYHNYPLTLTAEALPGEEVYGWEVNGTQIPGQELLLDESYEAEELKIKPMIRKAQ